MDTGGRLARLRREVQIAFGAGLLGVATASCAAQQASVAPVGSNDPSVRPEPAGSARSAAPAPGDGSAPGAARPKPAAPSGVEAAPGGTAVPIYGSPSIAIHSEVAFSHASLDVGPEGERTLAALTELLDAFDCSIEIHGHASQEEAKAAGWLSKRRAEVVRDRLLALGADSQRLRVSAHGTSQPKATSRDAPTRDRRVSFSFHSVEEGVVRACDAADRRGR